MVTNGKIYILTQEVMDFLPNLKTYISSVPIFQNLK